MEPIPKVPSMPGDTKTYSASTERTFKCCVDDIWTDTYDCDEREEIDVYSHLLAAVKGMMNGYRGYESEGFFKPCFYDIILRKPDLGSVVEAEKYVDDTDKEIYERMIRVFPMPWCYVPTPSETAMMAMELNPMKTPLAALYVATIKDYISLLDDGEKACLCRNLRVDYESGQKPKLLTPSKPSNPRKTVKKSKPPTKSKKINKASRP